MILGQLCGRLSTVQMICVGVGWVVVGAVMVVVVVVLDWWLGGYPRLLPSSSSSSSSYDLLGCCERWDEVV